MLWNYIQNTAITSTYICPQLSYLWTNFDDAHQKAEEHHCTLANVTLFYLIDLFRMDINLRHFINRFTVFLTFIIRFVRV